MAENKSNALGKFSSVSNVHWVVGLVASTVLSFILGLIVMGITNVWVLLIVVGIVNLILAAAVGFAVRLTSSATPNQSFWAAFVTGGLGIHVIVTLAGRGFDGFENNLWSAYNSAPFAAYVVFFGLIAALVATVGRRS